MLFVRYCISNEHVRNGMEWRGEWRQRDRGIEEKYLLYSLKRTHNHNISPKHQFNNQNKCKKWNEMKWNINNNSRQLFINLSYQLHYTNNSNNNNFSTFGSSVDEVNTFSNNKNKIMWCFIPRCIIYSNPFIFIRIKVCVRKNDFDLELNWNGIQAKPRTLGSLRHNDLLVELD